MDFLSRTLNFEIILKYYSYVADLFLEKWHTTFATF